MGWGVSVGFECWWKGMGWLEACIRTAPTGRPMESILKYLMYLGCSFRLTIPAPPVVACCACVKRGCGVIESSISNLSTQHQQGPHLNPRQPQVKQPPNVRTSRRRAPRAALAGDELLGVELQDGGVEACAVALHGVLHLFGL